eukprot:TRINITY_DN48772_c0_g1_i1.p2 TRINITY_DN48772_c0_g1~~TRINITY_DN48772_c0_g1_i1.p2  ORF type:complete len:141 (+),score=30.94 TRINITY_DN48772_c0_g1_i1:230-652(+)
MNICAVLSQIGDHDNAILHAQEAVTECRKELELKKTDNIYNEKVQEELLDLVQVLAISYHNLANEEEYFNNYQNALSNYKASVEILAEYFGGDHVLTKKFIARYNNFEERFKQIKLLSIQTSSTKMQELISIYNKSSSQQ